MNNVRLDLRQPDPEKAPNFWLDRFGNEYSQSANLETWTCKLKADGSLGCGWTAEEAFQRASDYHPLIMMSPEKIEKANQMATNIKKLSEDLQKVFISLHGYQEKDTDPTDKWIKVDAISVQMSFTDETYSTIDLDEELNAGILELLQTQIQTRIAQLREEFQKTFAGEKK